MDLGIDERGHAIRVGLAERNLLAASEPGAGKRAALEMVSEVSTQADAAAQETGVCGVAARAGVDADPRGLEEDEDALVARATRLEAAATPGRVLVSATVRRTVEPRFLWEPTPVDLGAEAGLPLRAHVPTAPSAVAFMPATPGVQAPAADAREAREERKFVVALFAGFSAGTPEQRRAAAAAVAVIERLEGTAKQFIRDPVVGFFGAPIAHEDDVERAVRAGLEIVGGADGVARVGLCAGRVVVGLHGASRHLDYTALGDAMNTAARLRSTAGSGELLAEASLFERVRDQFVSGETRALQLKGKAHAVRAVPVRGAHDPSPVAPRVAGQRDLLESPLLGRDDEVRLLTAAVERLAEGEGGLVVVEGAAGLGKSRLLRETARAARELGNVESWRCARRRSLRAFRSGRCNPLYAAGSRTTRWPSERIAILSSSSPAGARTSTRGAPSWRSPPLFTSALLH